MGGNGSKRKVSIDNDDPSSVIKVSEGVAKRMKNEGSVARPELRNTPISVNSEKGIIPSSNQNITQFQYSQLPVITSHDIRATVENELEANNKQWEKKMQLLQQSHEKINKVLEKEYNKAYSETEASLPRLPPIGAELPCLDKKAAALDCYKKNPKQPLICSQEIKAFANCISTTRVKLQKENKLCCAL